MKRIIATITLLLFFLTGGFGKEAHAATAELYSTSLYADANLAAYYRAEDATDSEDSGTDYDLTNVNSVAFNAAKFNNGFDFGTANTNKKLRSTTVLGISANAFTMSAWIKQRTALSSGAFDMYVSFTRASDKSNIYLGYYNNAGTMQLYSSRTKIGVSQATSVYNTDIGTSEFHHMAVTWDDSLLNLYLDGSLVATSSSSGAGTGTTVDCLTIGDYPSDNGNCSSAYGYYASAFIDDLAFFDRTLTAQEISDIYNGTAAATVSPVANIINFE